MNWFRRLFHIHKWADKDYGIAQQVCRCGETRYWMYKEGGWSK